MSIFYNNFNLCIFLSTWTLALAIDLISYLHLIGFSELFIHKKLKHEKNITNPWPPKWGHLLEAFLINWGEMPINFFLVHTYFDVCKNWTLNPEVPKLISVLGFQGHLIKILGFLVIICFQGQGVSIFRMYQISNSTYQGHVTLFFPKSKITLKIVDILQFLFRLLQDFEKEKKN